ncbi:MAG: MFS transporter [Thermodesulfobacteriota bacterium]
MTKAGGMKELFGLKRENSTLWAASLGHAYTHWFPSTFYLLLPLIKDELGLSYTEMGLLVTIRYVVSTGANFPSGMVVDLLKKNILILSMALAWTGIPYVFLGISNSYFILLLCMAIIGAGNNLWHPAAMTTLHEVYPKKRGWAIGWHASAANIGDALGPFLTGILLVWVTWRHILVGSFIPGLVLGVLVWKMLVSQPETSAEASQGAEKASKKKEEKRLSVGQYMRGLGRLLINPNIFLLSFINGIRTLTQNGLSTFLPSYFINLLHFSPWLSGVYLTIIQIAGIVAAPIAGRLSDRHGRKRVVRMALVSTSLGIFFLVFVNIQWLFIVFLGVIGFFLYSLRPVLIAWTMEVAPKELGGTAVSIQFSFQSALAALAPVLGGWIADKWGLIYTFYFLAATVLVSNVFVIFIREAAKFEAAEKTS